MNAVDRIKELCKEQHIAISKMEKDLGFANGYISQIRSGNIRSDRLTAIANYIGVSPNYLLTGEKENPATDGDGNDSSDIGEKYGELMRLIPRLSEEEVSLLLAQVKGIILGL